MPVLPERLLQGDAARGNVGVALGWEWAAQAPRHLPHLASAVGGGLDAVAALGAEERGAVSEVGNEVSPTAVRGTAGTAGISAPCRVWHI